jgi:hypothetical protein
MKLRFRGANIRAPSRQLGGNADRNPGRLRHHLPSPGEFAPQRIGRQIEQKAQGVDLLRLLLLQAGQLGTDGFDLCCGVLDVETGRQTLLLTRLRQLQNVPLDLQIIVGDPDQGLGAAQLDIVAGGFGEARDERVATLFLGILNLRVRRFDLAADMSPKIELP